MEIRKCTLCKTFLDNGPNPIVAASTKSKILIIGQAPGRIVHKTGVPWNDKSGDNLRDWLEIDKNIFFNEDIVALMPMGFCYPGTGKTGDLPPRPECAPLWHAKLLSSMPNIQIILLIGQYAQQYYLGSKCKTNLTETVLNYKDYQPKYFPLPHPSPRNNIWQAKNEWFGKEVLPHLRQEIKKILQD